MFILLTLKSFRIKKVGNSGPHLQKNSMVSKRAHFNTPTLYHYVVTQFILSGAKLIFMHRMLPAFLHLTKCHASMILFKESLKLFLLFPMLTTLVFSSRISSFSHLAPSLYVTPYSRIFPISFPI